MGKRCQKSKGLPYTAKFKCEVVQCPEKGNCKAAAFVLVHENDNHL
jgi:hypothetical protein